MKDWLSLGLGRRVAGTQAWRNSCNRVTRSAPVLVQDDTGAQTVSFEGRLRHVDGTLGPLSTLVATRPQPLVDFGAFTEQPLP